MHAGRDTPQAREGGGSVSSASQTDNTTSQAVDLDGNQLRGFKKALYKKDMTIVEGRTIISKLQAQVGDLEERVSDLGVQLEREKTARRKEREGLGKGSPKFVDAPQPGLGEAPDITGEVTNPEPRQGEPRTFKSNPSLCGRTGSAKADSVRNPCG